LRIYHHFLIDNNYTELMPNYNVGVLGATGAVGQKFIKLLNNHPWFTITKLGASSRSSGKLYREAAHWIENIELPDEIGTNKVFNCVPDNFSGVDFVFSGLDSEVAEKIEGDFARAGIPVISNAKNFRMQEDVPLLVPEVNPDHIQLINHQTFTSDGSGWIVTNPNCVVIPLVMALRPLHDRYGVKNLILTSMQAVSGAGYPGVASLDILGNVIPYIGGEESKIHTEPRKLLGVCNDNTIQFADIPIQATATRVPVQNGHVLSISVGLNKKPSSDKEVVDIFKNWKSPIAEFELPSAPEYPLKVYDEERFPQPKLQADSAGGMQTAIGRVRKSNVLNLNFVAMAHNTIRGAAGCAILNAELLAAKGYLG